MRTVLVLASLALALAAAVPTYAQQDQQQAPPVAGSVPLGSTTEQMSAVAVGYRASKLIGAAVYNDQNQRIGKIGDLIIAPDGTVTLAILDVGGFLGIGRHHVAIPVGHFSAVRPKIVLPGATKDALKKLPQFQYGKT